MLELDPGCELMVKEKYATLRLRPYSISNGRSWEDFYEIGMEAEWESGHTCEMCGAEGSIRDDGIWMKTLCDRCVALDPKGRAREAHRTLLRYYHDLMKQLRDYQLSDVEDEVRWTNVDTEWFYTEAPWMTMEPVDADDLRSDMAEIIGSMPEDAIRWRFEIEFEGKHIGMVSSYYLDNNFENTPWDLIDQSKNAHENNSVRGLGIEICEMEYWGKGIMHEALERVIRFGFEELGLHRIEAKYVKENERSRHVMEKVGMTFEGVLRGSMLVKGNYVDVGVCSLLRSEWEALQKKTPDAP